MNLSTIMSLLWETRLILSEVNYRALRQSSYHFYHKNILFGNIQTKLFKRVVSYQEGWFYILSFNHAAESSLVLFQFVQKSCNFVIVMSFISMNLEFYRINSFHRLALFW